MWKRIRGTWQRLTESLWFVPGLLVLGAGALAVAMVALSPVVDPRVLERFPRTFGAGADGSRSMLATIAGSMITVAGVTFSITVVAVAQASSQYTPRILRNFMRDRPSQLTLGVLVGTFVYCLIVIRTIRGDREPRFVPAVAVVVALLLALLGIGLLVYFIHHIASTLAAGSILARIRGETVAAVDRLFPDELEDGPSGAFTAAAPLPDATFDPSWCDVMAASTGYIQSVDAEGLLRLAAERRMVVRMARAVGEFVVEGRPLLSVADAAPDATLAAAVNALFPRGAYRSVHEDAGFGVRQMVDIALKALSPGVNDTTTAITSVDQLGAVLVRIVPRRIEVPYRTRDGELRVIARGPSFGSLLDEALDEIRRSAAGNARVLARMLCILQEVVACASSADRLERLRRHAELIALTAERHMDMAQDRTEVREAFRRVADQVDACRARS